MAEKSRSKQESSGAVDEFVVRKGKTWLCTTKKGKTEESMFLDFSLQIIGELRDTDCPSFLQWYLHLTPDEKALGEIERYILVDHNCLNTANHFLAAIKNGGYPKAGNGKNFNKQYLAVYFNNLKDNYDSSMEPRVFHRAKAIGYHNNIWVLSNENQYEGKKKLSKEEFRMVYSPSNSGYATLSLDVNEFLISDLTYFKDSLRRYYQLSKDAFTINSNRFILATSFVLRHIFDIMNGASPGAEESKFGVLSSKDKSCGKSSAQKLLLYGQGCQKMDKKKANPFFVAGGRLKSSSGVNIASLSDILTATNMVVCVDDISMLSESVIESILQLHNGLAQATKDTGLYVPEGVLMFSSNEEVPKRLHGRMVVIPFDKYDTRTLNSSYDALENQLTPFIVERKGLFIVWGMNFHDLWKEVKKELIGKFEQVFHILMPGEQPRVYKTWASLCSVQALFLTTCQAFFKVQTIVENVLKINQVDATETESLLEEIITSLEIAIKQTISVYGKENAHRWFHPDCSFNFKGHKYTSIAVKVTQASEPGPFKTVRFAYLKHLIGEKFGKTTTYTVVHFNDSPSKAYKIPKCILTEEFREFIDSEFQTSKTATEDVGSSSNLTIGDSPQSQSEVTASADEGSEADDFFDFAEFSELQSSIFDLKRKFTDYMEVLQDQSSQSSSRVVGTPFHQKLTPKTKRSFMAMSTDEKSAFRKGYASCQKKLFGNAEKYYSIEINNLLDFAVMITFKTNEETILFDIEEKAVLRKRIPFKTGDSCLCKAKTAVGEVVLIEEQEFMDINPETTNQLFKLKLTGLFESSIDSS